MSKKIISSVLVLAMIVCCIFALAACNQDPVEPGVFFTDDPNLEEVTFVLDWVPNTNHTGLYLAQKLGYFAEEGFKVNIIQPSDTGTSAQVAAGNGQYGIDFQEQMIWNFDPEKPVGVTAIAAVIQHNTSGILSAARDGHNIVTKEDMAGKVYATWGLPGEQAIVRSMNPDVKMKPNTVKDIIAEFKNPQGVDMVWSYAAWDKIMINEYRDENGNGIATNFIPMRDIEVEGKGKVLDYYTPVIIVNNEYKNANPEKVKKFMRAVSRGYNYAIENPHSAGYILMQANPELCENRNVIYKSQEFLAKEYKSDAPYWGHIDQARWDGFFNHMCSFETKDKNGDRIFPESIPAGSGFTNEFLPEYVAPAEA